MGAYLNALREEGSREDLFRELVKQIDRAERAAAALWDAAAYLSRPAQDISSGTKATGGDAK